jgi:siroheme synthase-like protein
MAKRYYMVCLDVEGRDCLVVGGSAVGIEKATGLLECGARVTVVDPDPSPDLATLPVTHLAHPYESRDLDGCMLVIAATSDTLTNRRVFDDAEARSIPCNVADVPELCSFILPAVLRRDPIAVAVSTGGASPVLAQRLRDQIAALVGPRHAELARTLEELRPWAKARFPTYEERREYFRRLVEEALG